MPKIEHDSDNVSKKTKNLLITNRKQVKNGKIDAIETAKAD